MEYNQRFAQKEIWFDVSNTDTDKLNKLAFVHLIKMKFDGEQIEVHSFGKPSDKTLRIILRFSDWDKCSEAKAHCDRNLKKGNIVTDYVGALDKADPTRIFAIKLERLAEQNYEDN